MTNEDKSAGFFSRWSRRKTDVREGRPLAEPKSPSALDQAPSVVLANSTDAPKLHAADVSAAPDVTPAPTLADAQQLTPESDFTGFMARGVDPEVKNAAMKKLFADPHFNVVDRMDIYIDDYSQPDPLPLAVLRQMTSAKTLNLFDDEPSTQMDANVGDKSELDPSKVVAQSAPAEHNSNIEPITHDHADLRLQPDPTARPEGAEPKPV